MSEGLAHRIDSEIRGVRIVFSMTRLLQRQPLSAPAARRAAKDFDDAEQVAQLHRFSGSLRDAGNESTFNWQADSALLVLRGDLLGFLAILTRLRESAAISDFDHVGQYAQDLYTILPSVCRICWLRPDMDLLLQCIEDMMVGLRWVPARAIKIDWHTFREQIREPRPYRGRPPWIEQGAYEFGRVQREQSRPVPLLEDVEPLWSYIRRPSLPEPPRNSSRRPKLFSSPSP
jgi:hypothetical protein